MAEVISLRAYLDELDDMLERESPTEVVSHCRHILKHYPHNVAAQRLLAQALLLKGQREGLQEHFQAAAEAFQRVLSAAPNDHIAHLGLSEIRQAEGALDAAIWHMERAYEQLPGNRVLHESFRRLLAEREGEENVPHKIQLTRTALARQYANGQLYDQALVEVRRAQEQAPGRLDLQVLLAEILWDSGRAVEAGEAAIQVLKKLPDALAANRIMARLWLDYERPSDARPYVERLETLDPYAAAEVIGAAEGAEPATLPRLDYHASAQAEMVASSPEWVHDLGDLPGQVDMHELFSAPPADASPAPADSPLPDWFAADDEAAPWELAGEETPAPSPGWPVAAPAQADDALPAWFADLDAPGEEATPAAPPPADELTAAAGAIEAAWLLDEEGETSGPAPEAPTVDWWAAAPPPPAPAPSGLTALLADLAEDYGAVDQAGADAGDESAEPALADLLSAIEETAAAEQAVALDAAATPDEAPAPDDEPPLDLHRALLDEPRGEDAALPDLFAQAEEPPAAAEPDAADFWSAFERAAADSTSAQPDPFAEIEADAPVEPEPPLPPPGVPGWLGDVSEWAEAEPAGGRAAVPGEEGRADEDLLAAPPEDEGAVSAAPHLPEWLSAADLLAEPASDDWLSEFEVPAGGAETDAEADAESPLPVEEALTASDQDELATADADPGLPDWLQLPVAEAEPTPDAADEETRAPTGASAGWDAQQDEELDDWLRSFTPVTPPLDAPVEADAELNIPVTPPLDEDIFAEEPTDDFFKPVLPELPSYLMEPAPEPSPLDDWLAEAQPAVVEQASEDEAEPDWLAGLEPLPAPALAPDRAPEEEPVAVPEVDELSGAPDETYDPFAGGSPDHVPQYTSTGTTGILQPDEQPDWMGAFTAELHALDALPLDALDAEPTPEPPPAPEPEPESVEPLAAAEAPPVPEPDAEFFAAPDEGPLPGWLAAITSAEDEEIDAALFGDLGEAGVAPEETEPEPAQTDVTEWEPLDEAEPSPTITGEPFDLLMEVAEDLSAAEEIEEPAAPLLDLSDVEPHEADALRELEAELAALATPGGAVPAQPDAQAEFEAELAALEASVESDEAEPDALAQLEAALAAPETVSEADALGQLEAELAALDTASAPGEDAGEADALARLEADVAARDLAAAGARGLAGTGDDDRDVLARLEAELAAAAWPEDAPTAPSLETELAEAALLADTQESGGAEQIAAARADAPVPADFSFGDLLPLWLRRPLEADPSALEQRRAGASERAEWLRDVSEDGERD